MTRACWTTSNTNAQAEFSGIRTPTDRGLPLLHNNDQCDDGPPPAPLILRLPRGSHSYYLELTPACNNRCPGCSNIFIEDYPTRRLKSNVPKRAMGFDEWRIVLDKIVSHTRYVNVTGGEATLHPHFAEIVSYLGRLDIPFVLLTNGRWQDPESLTAMLSSIPQCYGILVSLHGSTADVHEVFTGVVGSFDETIANIQRTVRAGMPVETSTVITHQNCRQLEQIAELARRLGARRAKFNRYLAWEAQHGLLDHMLPSDSELITAVKTIEHLRRTTLDEFDTYYGPCIPQCFTPSSSHGCSAGETFCAIDPWGNVTPCTHTSLTCGNLLEMDIEQIWNGEVMEAWRNLMPEGCSGCSLLSQCGTGCRAMAVESGLGYDPLMRRPIRADSTLPLYASIPRFDIPTNLASKTTISHT